MCAVAYRFCDRRKKLVCSFLLFYGDNHSNLYLNLFLHSFFLLFNCCCDLAERYTWNGIFSVGKRHFEMQSGASDYGWILLIEFSAKNHPEQMEFNVPAFLITTFSNSMYNTLNSMVFVSSFLSSSIRAAVSCVHRHWH